MGIERSVRMTSNVCLQKKSQSMNAMRDSNNNDEDDDSGENLGKNLL